MFDRPFEQYYHMMELLELRRRKGLIQDDRHIMTLDFVQQIGSNAFIENAVRTFTIVECASFFGVTLLDADNLQILV